MRGAASASSLPPTKGKPMRCRHLVAAVFCASLAAQNYTVSPASLTNTTGNGGNTIPWWSATHRYQQIHGDMRNRVLLVLGVALRRSSGGPYAAAVARTIDAEMFMGNADYATASTSFAGNYVGTPTNTVLRKMINCPDLVNTVSTPEPWLVQFPHDAPFVYTGRNDAAWELKIYSTTSTGVYSIDVYSGSLLGTYTLTGERVGIGCTATGRSTPMTLGSTFRTISATGSDTHDLAWAVANAPANALTMLFLDTQGVNLPIPGLCTNLTAGPLVMVGGTADGAGAFTLRLANIPFDPTVVNLQLHAQAICPDAGQPGLQFALTNGDRNLVPPQPPRIMRLYVDNVNSATGSRETSPYGLVTRFQHQ